MLSEIGYDMLVLDHHEAEWYSTNAVVINNQLSGNYPNKALSGVGVVYKFFEYVESRINDYGDFVGSLSELGHPSENYLDLVALGEISDVMNMTTLENRWICDYGLSHINNAFFKEIIEKQAFSLKLDEGPLTQIGVAFYITPLLNSMIRVGTAAEKERVFLAFIDGHHLVPCNKRGAKGTMEEVAIESLRECTNTKSKQDKITTAAVDNLSIRIFNEELDKNKLLIVELDDDDDYPQEVNGLVAMKLASKYNLPTLLGRTNEDGEIKGSIRGMNNSELTSLRDFLLKSNCVNWVTG